MGPQGIQGPEGPAGPPGPAGPVGPAPLAFAIPPVPCLTRYSDPDGDLVYTCELPPP